MSEVYRKLQTCLESVRARTGFKPEIALILGDRKSTRLNSSHRG